MNASAEGPTVRLTVASWFHPRKVFGKKPSPRTGRSNYQLPHLPGKVILCIWTEDRKGAGTNSGESGARNLEAESIRSRAEGT